MNRTTSKLIRPLAFWTLLLIGLCSTSHAFPQTFQLQPAPSPIDNPLKGLVPYARPTPDRFPHSMEFSYLGLASLMKEDKTFDWTPLEDLLNDIASRGNQAVIRIYLEYPGKSDGIPDYLVRNGLKIHKYANTNTAPFPPTDVITPDYADPKLKQALVQFIQAWGQKYDGDPRLAYITAGLLGTWGEWHTYPRNDLWASKDMQASILDAYQSSFRKTPILLRYPAGSDHDNQTENTSRPFGYHDDSFCWATLDTGRSEDNWFFVPALRDAKALDKWKTAPIGGEIRPEAWGKIFDDPKSWPTEAQAFSACVNATHASWLMDSGMFQSQASPSRLARASEEVRRMGYDLHIAQVTFKQSKKLQSPNQPPTQQTQTKTQLQVSLDILNQGVAPFYAPWPTEVAIWNQAGQQLLLQEMPSLNMQSILPSDQPTTLSSTLPLPLEAKGKLRLGLRIRQPLANGKPVRFANATQDQFEPGWLHLGHVTISP